MSTSSTERRAGLRHSGDVEEHSYNIKHDTDILLLLERGRRVAIRQGEHLWEAVYWGREGEDEIVACRSDDHWRLQQLDLHRYGDGLEVGDLLSRHDIQAIEEDLVNTMGVE